MKIINRVLKEEQQKIKDELIKENFNPIYAHILALRNVKSIDEAKYQYKLIKPSLLKGIDVLSEKLAQNIIDNKKITIVADYDCDGATSCAIAYKGLKLLQCINLDFIVPNRFKHGYGLSPSIIDDLIIEKGKPDCIVTVDNGIAAHEGINYANSLGIEVLVTDHHLPVKDKENPLSAGLVNPNQEGDTSGLKNMAGCGVIFYVLVETLERLIEKGFFTKENKPNMLSLIDLVSLGTIADVVKLDKNNRLLVKYGLQLLHKGQGRKGLFSLFNIAQKNIYHATSRDYGFSIAPRINAAGRLEDMTVGIKCLISNEIEEGNELASQLNDLNVQRKSIENEMKEIAYELMENQSDKMTRVIYDENYHEGVIGIVAGRIKEKENVPVIVFSPTEDEELIKGSGRSIPEVHLRDAIDLVSKVDPKIFKGFGGHAMAAGLTIYKDRLDDFKQHFEEAVISMIGDEPLTKEIFVDYELKPSEITLDLVKRLENEIWGQGFLEPTFKTSFRILEMEYLNSKETGEPVHTKYTLSPIDKSDNISFNEEIKSAKTAIIDSNGNEIETIEGITALHFFNLSDYKIGDEITLIYKTQVSRFRNSEKVALLVSHVVDNEGDN